MTNKEAIKILDGMEYMPLNRSAKDVQSAVIMAINLLYKAENQSKELSSLRSQLAEAQRERDAESAQSWAEKASDGTNYNLSYANGIYTVTDNWGCVECEFIRSKGDNHAED